MSRIRVCHVQVLPILSGVQRAMLAYFEALPSDRYEVVVVCQERGPLTDELDRLRIRHVEIPELDRAIHPVRDFRALGGLIALFRRERFDVVHTHSSKPGILGRLAAFVTGVPAIVHHNHGYAWNEGTPIARQFLYSWLEKVAAWFCDSVVFVAEETRTYSDRKRILPLSKSETIYNGIDLEALRPPSEAERQAERRTFELSDSAFVAAFVGRLWDQKNPLALIPLAQEAMRFAPEQDWLFVVAGDGPLRGQLEAAIRDAGLSRNFRLLGWLDDTSALYRASDVLISTSHWEGLPLVLTEGMAAGLPALCSDIPGSREAVTGDVGYRAPVGQPEVLGARLAELARDRARLESMRRSARARAERLFDRSTNIRRVPELYSRLLETPGASFSIRRLLRAW